MRRIEGVRRIDVRAARDVLLEDVVLHRAGELADIRALLAGDGDVEREQDRRRGVDGHRGGDPFERDAVEERAHVVEAARSRRRPCRPRPAPAGDRRRSPSASAGRRRPRGRSALLQQVAVALVGLLGGGEAGVLAHRPEAPAIHRRLDAARVGILAG